MLNSEFLDKLKALRNEDMNGTTETAQVILAEVQAVNSAVGENVSLVSAQLFVLIYMGLLSRWHP